MNDKVRDGLPPRPRSRPDRSRLLAALIELLRAPAPRGAGNFSLSDREDAIMDAIVRVLEWEDGPADVEGGELPRAYASRIVVNRLIDQWRHAQRSPLGAAEALDEGRLAEPRVATDSGTEDLPADTVAAERLLSDLAPTDRDLLQAWLGGTEHFADETRRQGLAPGTARVRVHRMLARLRKRRALFGTS